MTINAAVATEQKISFVIVEVKKSVLQSPTRARTLADMLSGKFPGKEVTLMARNIHGRPTFWGREDIVKYLSRQQMNRYTWKAYEL